MAAEPAPLSCCCAAAATAAAAGCSGTVTVQIRARALAGGDCCGVGHRSRHLPARRSYRSRSTASSTDARSHSARANSDGHAVGVRAVKLGAAAAELQRSKLAARRAGSAFTACRERYDCIWTSEQLIDGLELPSCEDDNFNPGTRRGATGGSPPPLLAPFTQLFGYRPLSLTCIYVSVRTARLCCSMRPGCVRARHRDLNAALRAAGSTWFFGSCAHWHMRGFLGRCGCPRTEVSAPGGALAVGTHTARTRHDAHG